jgi:membrane protease YdiL (CAAX protease family)
MTSVPPPSYQHPGAPPPRPELPEGVERPPPPSPARSLGPRTKVPVWAPIAAMLAAFLGGTVVFAVLAVATGTASVDSTPEGVTLGATLAQDLLLVVGALLAVKFYEGGVRPDWFGLRTTPFWPAVGACAAMLAAWWLFVLIVLLILGKPPDQELVEELKSERSELVLAAFGVLVCVFAPICEELFFRGFMFRVFADRVGIVAGAALSGAIFGLVHLPGSPLVTGLVLFGLGFGFAMLRWWTGSLLPPMALHALNNAYSFGGTLTLDWWIFMLVLAGSTAVVLAIGLWMSNSNWGRLNA